MVGIFERCLRDAQVFEREIPGRSLFERSEIKKNGCDWAVLAAGVGEDQAAESFRGGSGKADRATVPIGLIGGGQMRLLMVLRPTPWPTEAPHPTGLVTHYAPGDGVPFVEIHSGYIRVEFP